MCRKNGQSTTEAHNGHQHEGGHQHHVTHSPEEWAKRLDDPARDAWQRPQAVIDALHIIPGQTVADIGAGTGYLLKYLSRAVGTGGQVLAHDVEAGLVEYLRLRADKEKLTNVAVRLCPFDDPALPFKRMDRIIIVNTWHHMQNRIAYAQKLAVALNDTGALYIVDFTKHSTVGPPAEEKLEARQVVLELEQAGMKVALIDEDLLEQYLIKGTAP